MKLPLRSQPACLHILGHSIKPALIFWTVYEVEAYFPGLISPKFFIARFLIYSRGRWQNYLDLSSSISVSFRSHRAGPCDRVIQAAFPSVQGGGFLGEHPELDPILTNLIKNRLLVILEPQLVFSTDWNKLSYLSKDMCRPSDTSRIIRAMSENLNPIKISVLGMFTGEWNGWNILQYGKASDMLKSLKSRSLPGSLAAFE